MNSAILAGLISAPLKTKGINFIKGAVTVSGGSANKNLVLSSKGSGSYIFGPAPDGTVLGGNARGAGAIDLQTSRTAATQVGVGPNSVTMGSNCINLSTSGTVIGRSHNLAISDANYAGASIIGGSDSGISGLFGGNNTITSGFFCTIAGDYLQYSGIFNSRSCSITGNLTNILGGYYSSANSSFSLIYGSSHAKTDRLGQQATSHHGFFSIDGDSQRVDFMLRKVVVGAAQTELALDNATTYLSIPSGKVFFFTARVLGVKSDGSEYASFLYSGTIKNVGTITSMSAGVFPMVADDNSYGCTLSITATDSAGAGTDWLSIKVTNGTTGGTWRWNAHVQGLEIGYGT